MRSAKAARTVLLLLPMYFMMLRVAAQPLLPGITGVAEHGVVMLSWNCQYEGVKAIAVKRSTDSLLNYKVVGYVKETTKGLQQFADEQPVAGSSFYKLSITFNSGLNWSSNHCRVVVDSASLKRHEEQELQTKAVVNVVAHNIDKKPVQPPSKPVTAVRIFLPIPEPDVFEPTFIRSRYVTVQRLTGHVSVSLPNGIDKQQCSIVFYNDKGRVQVEIPEIKATYFLIDKRNFQRSGIYKFVLRKDGIELESGYVTLSM